VFNFLSDDKNDRFYTHSIGSGFAPFLLFENPLEPLFKHLKLMRPSLSLHLASSINNYFFGSDCMLPHPLTVVLLLVRKLGSTNVGTTQLDVQHTLHGTENLLVRSGGSSLKVGDGALCGVAAGSEILLCHLGLHLLSGGGDGVADQLTNGVGLDDVVGSVNLGQALTFSTTGSLQGNLLAEAAETWRAFDRSVVQTP
jgi:hypothetical protein